MMPSILVTPRSFSEGHNASLAALAARGYNLVLPAPGRVPTEAELIAAIPDCTGWIAGVEPVSPAVIAAARKLRVISRNGSGIDNLPMGVISERGIVVRTAIGANARAVAELALALAFAGLRHVPLTDRQFRAGAWPRMIGREMGSARVAVIGLGAIGQQSARLFLPLAAEVIGYDPFQPADLLTDQPGFRRAATLAAAVQDADLVSLHLPASPDGRPVFDGDLLALMSGRAILVNTARSSLVDQDAMLAALESGHIAVYATDVYDREPPEMTALLRNENTILTSHIGGYTRECVARIVETTVSNLLDGLGDDIAHD